MLTQAALATGFFCASSALASPITIEFPPTNPLQFVRVTVSGGDDAGDYSRTTACGGLSGRSGAENAQRFADHQNDGSDGRSWRCQIDPANPARVRVVPSGAGSEPTVQFNNDRSAASPILRAQRNPRPGTPDVDELGFVRIDDFLGNAMGGGEFGLACGLVSAVVTTTPDMAPEQILDGLALQLRAQGATFARQSGALTLYGLGELSAWTSDAGAVSAVAFGSTVPGTGPLALLALGAALGWRRRRR